MAWTCQHAHSDRFCFPGLRDVCLLIKNALNWRRDILHGSPSHPRQKCWSSSMVHRPKVKKQRRSKRMGTSKHAWNHSSQTGGIPTPLKNMKVSWDDWLLFPIYGKIKFMFQTTNQQISWTRQPKFRAYSSLPPHLASSRPLPARCFWCSEMQCPASTKQKDQMRNNRLASFVLKDMHCSYMIWLLFSDFEGENVACSNHLWLHIKYKIWSPDKLQRESMDLSCAQAQEIKDLV